MRSLINKNLTKVFQRFGRQKIDKILSFLSKLSLTPSRLTERLERLNNFMQRQFVDYESRDSFKRLNIMIQILNALENNSSMKLITLSQKLIVDNS